ncbi:sensor histidine kinase [Reinekea marina]|uniref:histidine kinase n=1 Tax=Reinekea marina TaxID=1310421 RepID=A0ABV7WLM2_9GAMM|nr:sensor histidine kinase [Reinekea marina]MDN3648443.1 sensor histidine kinase [Reinekea marina]
MSRFRLLKIRKLKLGTRLMWSMSFISLLQATLIGGFAWVNLSVSLDREIGQRALSVAKTVAAVPAIIEGVEQRDSASLNHLAQHLARTNDALFIVIGDKNSLRLAHPNPSKLGLSMADDDGDTGAIALLQGEAYIDKAEGSLGYSTRGKAPIYDQYGEDIIGIVSVGYSLSQVQATIQRYSTWLTLVLVSAIIGSILAAIVIARRLKREIFGLEPEEIARKFQEQEATLQSVVEGIIAINKDGIVTTFNRRAIEMLGLDTGTQLEGLPIETVLPDTKLLELMSNGVPQFDLEVWLHNKQLVVNRLPVKFEGEIIGAVSSFRPRDEVDAISQQLTKIEQYADTLRSQAHEYSNKLHTIAGLIQLDAKQDALALIGREAQDHQALITLLVKATPNPVIAGCLLGKYNRAKEMGLSLRIDNESELAGLPKNITQDQLASVLGNLIDNALEATLNSTGAGGEVSISFTDIGQDVIIEVQDQGPGVPIELQETIFTKGYSSKTGREHGIGLYLIANIIQQCQGHIDIENLEPKGSRFILYLPKTEGAIAL